MDVSVETLNNLERKVSVTLSSNIIEEEVSQRLRELARKVKIDGFRPGKAPLNLVKSRYSDSVREDVSREMIRSTLFEALQSKNITPAGMPYIAPGPIEAGKDFTYVATFEVFPEITIHEIVKDKIEQFECTVSDADVKKAIEKLQEQHKEWEKVKRAVAEGDKVNVDFEGFIDGEPFSGGSAKGHEFIVGSGSMIPDFEKGIIGAKQGKPFEVEVVFPEDYHHKPLAGQKTVFKMTVNDVYKGVLPPVDDAFAEKFNIKEGGVEVFMADIKQNMQRELERRLSNMNREKIYDKFLELNPIDLPKALIDKEIENLKHEFYHKIFGHEHSENEKIPDFPREIFEEKANRRVHLGLLFNKYVELHAIEADKEKVNAFIEQLATAYEKPQELRDWYDKAENRGDVEALILEETVAEKMAEQADLVKLKKSYDELMYDNKESQIGE